MKCRPTPARYVLTDDGTSIDSACEEARAMQGFIGSQTAQRNRRWRFPSADARRIGAGCLHSCRFKAGILVQAVGISSANAMDPDHQDGRSVEEELSINPEQKPAEAQDAKSITPQGCR